MIQVNSWQLYSQPVDMRKGIEGFILKIVEHSQQSLKRRVAYLFCNKSGTRLKVLIWDGSGFWLCLRKLEQGKFTWPKPNGIYNLNASEFSWLCAGLDWQRWDKTLSTPLWV